jgi:CYTH domain-containing protein
MKNREIERKFLVKDLPDLEKRNYEDITQGYLDYNTDSNYITRLRQILYMSHTGQMLGEDYFFTVKGVGLKDREEREAQIWRGVFSTFWSICGDNVVHKHRYHIPSEDSKHTVHLDIYKNELSGFVTAEVEFETHEECDAYKPESWFAEEVTDDKRYTNVHLAIDKKYPKN